MLKQGQEGINYIVFQLRLQGGCSYKLIRLYNWQANMKYAILSYCIKSNYEPQIFNYLLKQNQVIMRLYFDFMIDLTIKGNLKSHIQQSTFKRFCNIFNSSNFDNSQLNCSFISQIQTSQIIVAAISKASLFHNYAFIIFKNYQPINISICTFLIQSNCLNSFFIQQLNTSNIYQNNITSQMIKFLLCIFTLCSLTFLTAQFGSSELKNYGFAAQQGSDVNVDMVVNAMKVIKQSSGIFGNDVQRNAQRIQERLSFIYNCVHSVVITKAGNPQDQFAIHRLKEFWMSFKEGIDQANPQWSYLIWRSPSSSGFAFLDQVGRGSGVNQNLYDLIQLYAQDDLKSGNCDAASLSNTLTKIIPDQLWNVVCQTTGTLQLTGYVMPKSGIWSVHSYNSKTAGNGYYLVWSSFA